MSFICEGAKVLVDHEWFVIDEVDGDTLFCLDEDGGEHEFKINDVFVLDSLSSTGYMFLVHVGERKTQCKKS